MEPGEIGSAQGASQLIQQVDHVPTTIPLLLLGCVAQGCQHVHELLLNSLLAFKTYEQPLENGLQSELYLTVPHVLFRLRLHQTVTEQKFQVTRRNLLGHLLDHTLRHIFHHYWVQGKHGPCFSSFQE